MGKITRELAAIEATLTSMNQTLDADQKAREEFWDRFKEADRAFAAGEIEKPAADEPYMPDEGPAPITLTFPDPSEAEAAIGALSDAGLTDRAEALLKAVKEARG